MQCRFGSQGDYSAIALAPSSVQEMFDLTAKAFNLADRFRCPVFVMSDEIIGHMREKVTIPEEVEIKLRKPLKEGKLPFQPEESMVPGFPEFGKGYRVHVTGLTHDERGYPEATDCEVHSQLVNRLVDKIESKRHEIADYDIVNPGAEIVFLTYGPPGRSVRQLIHDHPDMEIGHLNLRIVWPFPEEALKKFPNASKFIIPELNLGQIAREVQRHTDVEVESFPKIGGEMHTPEELFRAMGGVLR